VTPRPTAGLPEQHWAELEKVLPTPPPPDWEPAPFHVVAFVLARYAAYGLALFPCWHAWSDGSCACPRRGTCPRPGKHPRTPNGLRAATRDVARILAYHEKVPYANWAVATGVRSGVDVLDVDPEKGGMESLARLEEELGLGEDLYTWTGLTGGGGAHYYFAHYPGMKSNVGRLGPGLDVRAGLATPQDSGDGYVLLWPSNHAKNPRTGAYDWLLEPWAAPLTDWPEALAQRALGPKPLPAPAPLPAHVLEELGKEVPQWLQQSAKVGAPQGQRHDRGLYIACRARQFVADDRLGYALLETFARSCRPPLGVRETERLWGESAKLQGFAPRYHPRAQRYEVRTPSHG
jgi:hypothetical protein